MTDTKLNLGCDRFKLPGFVNIDINPNVNPDKIVDLTHLDEEFEEKSIDFIFAGHVLEHLIYTDSLNVLRKCQKILKPFRMMLIIVPDYSKCSELNIEMAEKVIMAGGDHKMLFNKDRLYNMIKESGFSYAYEITNLKEVPFMLVSNVYDPKPDPWQSCFIAFKT